MLEVKMYDDVEFRKRNEKFGHKKIEFIEIEMDPGNWSKHSVGEKEPSWGFSEYYW